MSYVELARISGELVPDRLAMSSVMPPFATGGEPAVGPAEHGTSSVTSACQAIHSPGSGGLLGVLGLGTPPFASLSCIPAAVTTTH